MIRWIKTNPKLAGATIVVYTFMVAAAAISAFDIVHLAEKYGVPAPISYTAPLFIDGLAWLGKIGRSKDFEESTRSAGLKLMAFGGLLSLAANVTVGETVGLKVYGALVVTGFIVAEWYSAKLEAKTAASESTESTPVVSATALHTAQKKAADAARTLAAKSPTMRPAELARATGVSAGTAGRILKAVQAIAPTSPGPMGPGPAGPSVEQLAEIVGTPAYI